MTTLAASWSVTPAHLRAVVLGMAALFVSVVAHRPDLVVLGTPLVVVAAWGASGRVRASPEPAVRLSTELLHEGEGAVVRIVLRPATGVRHVCAVLAPSAYTAPMPPSGVTSRECSGHEDEVYVDARFRSTRWGRRPVGAIVVVGNTGWNAYRWGPASQRLPDLTSLPLPAAFDARAQPPHPTGLVGLHRSARAGDGSEFAGIRPFQPGDRMRRVHWPVSLRSEQLHVTSTYADHDSHVLLIVDATADLGSSGGIDGAASSLDLTVRAAAAIAEHHLRIGDRVGLRLLGGRGVSRIPTATGRTHLRRVLVDLATMQRGWPDRDLGLRRLGVPAGALVVVLSPLASGTALVPAVTLTRRGLAVVVVDTLPVDHEGLFTDPAIELAWRIRVLEREVELQRVTEAGVPVVRWRGPGSLDQVLRDMGRQAAAPRLAHR